jgi:hypothetical protein
MATLQTLGRPSGLPLSLLSQAIHRLSRHELEDLAQSLIDRLDAVDGDPDLEDDDPAGQCDEDGVNTALHVLANCAAGCLLSDDDVEDGGVVARYDEDQTRGPTKWRNRDA